VNEDGSETRKVSKTRTRFRYVLKDKTGHRQTVGEGRMGQPLLSSLPPNQLAKPRGGTAATASA
jgi:hypothetical protein